MSRRKHHKPGSRALWVALILSAGMLAAGMYFGRGFDPRLVGKRLAWPLFRLMLVIAAGLAVGQIIEATGWTSRLGRIGGPLFRYARLGPRCSATFATAFVSGAAANAMLYDFWQEDKISRYQLFLTNLANQLPAFLLHLPTTVFIVLPLTGWAGGYYFLITFAAALLRFVLVLLIGHWRPASGWEADARADQPEETSERGKRGLLGILRAKLPGRLMGIATYVIPIYVAVFLLSGFGIFDWTRQWMTRWITTAFIPVEALSLVVLSFAAEFTSGFAAAGALMHSGVISIKQAVLALLIGNVVAFPIRALRHQLPRLLGIFTPKMGMQLLLLGQGFRIASLVLVGGLYYMVF